MQGRVEPLVLEPTQSGMSDRDLGILAAGGLLGVIAVALATRLLAPGFVVIVVLLLCYPLIGLWRTYRRGGWPPKAPRLVLGPDALELGGQLRIRWKDVSEVAARQPPGASPRTPERVCIRVNRLGPVQPVPSTLRRLGLGGYDGYFDITIPSVYGVPAVQLAAAMEERRARAAAAPALGAGEVQPRPRRRKAPPATP